MSIYILLAAYSFAWLKLVFQMFAAFAKWRAGTARRDEVAIPFLYATAITWFVLAMIAQEAFYAKILPTNPDRYVWVSLGVAGTVFTVAIGLQIRSACREYRKLMNDGSSFDKDSPIP